MAKYRCWEPDVEEEEDGKVFDQEWLYDHKDAAKEYAELCYSREPTDWSTSGVDIMVRDLESQKLYKCVIGTEWDPSFYLMECQETRGGDDGTDETAGDRHRGSSDA